MNEVYKKMQGFELPRDPSVSRMSPNRILRYIHGLAYTPTEIPSQWYTGVRRSHHPSLLPIPHFQHIASTKTRLQGHTCASQT